MSRPEPYWTDEGVTLHLGDCRAVMAAMEPASIDAIITDPPYDLTAGKKGGSGAASLNPNSPAGRSRIGTGGGFMGKAWDATGVAFDPATWQEALRILKPGGYLLAFGGTRTWHRLVCAIEDAGFEIRDCVADLTGQDAPGLMWCYGNGFPKSLDVSKAIDKARNDRPDILRVTAWLADMADTAGIGRAQVDAHMGTSDMGGWWLSRLQHRCAVPTWEQWLQLRELIGFGVEMDAEVWRLNGRKGTPGEAWDKREITQQANGANRPGDIISFDQRSSADRERRDIPASAEAARWDGFGTALKPGWEPIAVGRKPLLGTVAANVLAHGAGALNVRGCRVGAEPRINNAGGSSSLQRVSRVEQGYRKTVTSSQNEASEVVGRWPANVVLGETAAAEMDRQSGASVSRVGRPRQSEKPGDGYGMTHTGAEYADAGGASRFFPVFKYEAKAPASERPRLPDGTAHPTVKPVDLMAWLVRLVTPPGGTVLDCFAGSGTTAEACIVEGFSSVLIEQDPSSAELIKTRLRKPIQPGLFSLEAS